MLTEKQKQIIRLLLTNKEGYNVNQIARILSISVSWTHETLKFLEREGILASAKIANSIFFKVNWNNPKAEKICDFIILDEQSKESLIKKDEKHTNKFENSVKITDKNNYGIANNPVSESNVYSVGSNLFVCFSSFLIRLSLDCSSSIIKSHIFSAFGLFQFTLKKIEFAIFAEAKIPSLSRNLRVSCVQLTLILRILAIWFTL